MFWGDHLNQSTLLFSALCCAALCICASGADSTKEQSKTLTGSELNFSEANLTLFSSLEVFGSFGIGEAVKFTAPSSGFNLQKVRILAWSGFNNTTKTYPAERDILLEIRDKDLNLLYKFADGQNNYFLSSEGPIYGEIEIPEMKMTGDFYVVFYDRGAAPIGAADVAESGNSYLFNGAETFPAEFVDQDTNETIGYNWVIEAIGK